MISYGQQSPCTFLLRVVTSLLTIILVVSAWNVVGLAIRYSQTLGLNLRNDVPDLDEAEKEMRARMWYTLYSLEYLLCIMTGRPSCIHDKDCSVPMPRPVDEDRSDDGFDAALRRYSEIASPASLSSNRSSFSSSFAFRVAPSTPQPMSSTTASSAPSPSTSNPVVPSTRISAIPFVTSGRYPSTYFVEHTKLNQITAEILSELYSPATRNKSWSDIQGVISAMELKVKKWRANLPPLLDFSKRQGDRVYSRQVGTFLIIQGASTYSRYRERTWLSSTTTSGLSSIALVFAGLTAAYRMNPTVLAGLIVLQL